MTRDSITRRRFVQAVAGTTAALGASGVVAGERPDRHLVGTNGPAATERVKGRADSVRRVLDFGDIGQAVAGRFPEEALDALVDAKDVRYVEEDGLMYAHGAEPQAPGGDPGPPGGGGGGGDSSECTPWGVDRTDAEVAAANGSDGSGADVAILDTGIDPDHPDLQANLGAGKAFVECKGGNGCETTWADDEGHGTHCAGIAGAVGANSTGVQGVATGATLHAVKVLDKRGSGSFSDVAAGIEYTADQGWDVGSMSLGASSGSQTVKDACTYAYDRGVLLVASAGNSGPCSDCVGYPAAYSEVIAVSSTAKDDSLSGFSSTGPEVELAAPGSNVYSTYDDGAYETLSGTSMSCPHVSGAGGVLMANGDSNTQARDGLKSSAEDVGLSSNESGAGLLDVAAAVGLDSSDDGTGDC